MVPKGVVVVNVIVVALLFVAEYMINGTVIKYLYEATKDIHWVIVGGVGWLVGVGGVESLFENFTLRDDLSLNSNHYGGILEL